MGPPSPPPPPARAIRASPRGRRAADCLLGGAAPSPTCTGCDPSTWPVMTRHVTGPTLTHMPEQSHPATSCSMVRVQSDRMVNGDGVLTIEGHELRQSTELFGFLHSHTKMIQHKTLPKLDHSLLSNSYSGAGGRRLFWVISGRERLRLGLWMCPEG